MIALTLSDDFVRQATEAGQRLLESGERVVEMKNTPGHFVIRADAKLPEGATRIAIIEVAGTPMVIYMQG